VLGHRQVAVKDPSDHRAARVYELKNALGINPNLALRGTDLL
jgi:hypothetical protein